ncbi:transcriptional regulator, DeoR family [Halogranum amylolyticum]|uniref:Transcriptional regulator, DeoR family n=1 Tax=Halogranum amylolyticum TaxID=660520 RepID=A0A1H8TL31_9EURY|nr:HTH-type transcriptional regulator GlpR [Halogranum amylolyticum]SEO91284.1 transcriptional regulator, DeoR family [Halogranum amylolyticum]
MLPRQRKRRIIELVTERNGESVDTLAEELDVSAATIRRDLQQLAEEGLVERSHGGALPVKSVGNERSYGQKEIQHLEEKQAIAAVAVEEIRHGEVVFFDSGTTTMEVAKKAPRDDSFVAVTNSPLIALELRKQEGEVQLTGGSLRQRTKALVGPTAEQFMDTSNFDVAFVGTNGIDEEGRLTTPKAEEARMKELMIENSKRVVLVSVSGKLGEQSFKRFGTLRDVNVFITDEKLSPEHRQWFEDANVRVVDEVVD